MVLQNKYKARASRRYNASRGGVGSGRGRGRARAHRYEETSFPSLPAERPNEEEGEGGELESNDESQDEEDEQVSTLSAKYAPRKVTSNAWRYADPVQDGKSISCSKNMSLTFASSIAEQSKVTDDGEEEGEEDEGEDLSELIARVSKMDSSRTTNALSSQQAASEALEADDADVDSSLSYLLERQAQRERGHHPTGTPRHALSEEQKHQLEMEGRKLQEEKAKLEKHERRRRLLQQETKTISLHIGDQRRGQSSLSNNKQPMHRSAVVPAEDEQRQPRNLHDVDSFLAEVDASRHSEESQGPRSASLQRKSRATPAQAASEHKEMEDFLDSVL